METAIIRGQEKFDLHDLLNPIEIEINNNRILNTIKKHKKIYYRLTRIIIFFPSSVKMTQSKYLSLAEN